MATITLPLVDGSSHAFDTDDISGVGAMSAAALVAAGVHQGTTVTEGVLDYNVAMSIQDVLTAFYANTSGEKFSSLKSAMGGASVTKTGALSDIAGAEAQASTAGDYVIIASAILGVSAAATAGVLAQLTIGGVAVGPAFASAATTFVANAAPEKSLSIVYKATLAASDSIKLQGGSSGTGDALFFRPSVVLIPCV